MLPTTPPPPHPSVAAAAAILRTARHRLAADPATPTPGPLANGAWLRHHTAGWVSVLHVENGRYREQDADTPDTRERYRRRRNTALSAYANTLTRAGWDVDVLEARGASRTTILRGLLALPPLD